MKLKQRPEDFQVDELATLPIRGRGPFAVYRLTKSGWTTLDAIRRICRDWNLPRSAVGHAGMKDRHAVTSQLITIQNGPRQAWNGETVQLEYLGQSPRKIGPNDIEGNSFRLVVRGLSSEEGEKARSGLPGIQLHGYPNYFDDQRFGSWFPGQGFIAEWWLREKFEQACWLAFAEPQSTDNAHEREEKEILRRHWGDWAGCVRELRPSHRRSIVTYLKDHPEDFTGAWCRVDGHLRGLFLSALQSDLWNRCVSYWHRTQTPRDQLLELRVKTGPLLCPKNRLSDSSLRIGGGAIPLPSARLKDVPEEVKSVMRSALSECGWELEQLKVRLPRDKFFSKAQRPMHVVPSGLHWRFAADELAPEHEQLTLSFTLTRGAYATMLVKRLWDCQPL
ncbi:MAG: tRNA pseudouridine(13) synthase TruD [Planctomycetaceae bacterium]|nr:tRNA pseudouridine(13) synthase TruD [Planctomycetaceae bacterium]